MSRNMLLLPNTKKVKKPCLVMKTCHHLPKDTDDQVTGAKLLFANLVAKHNLSSITACQLIYSPYLRSKGHEPMYHKHCTYYQISYRYVGEIS